MVSLRLWILFALWALSSADNDSGSNESGRRHGKHKHYTELISDVLSNRRGNIYPQLPPPSGYAPHTYNHPAYPVPNVYPAYGWYPQPQVGYSLPVHSAQPPQGYFGLPHGPIGYAQNPYPYQAYQPLPGYGFPISNGYNSNVGGFQQLPGNGAYGGPQLPAVSQHPLPEVQNQQTPYGIRQQQAAPSSSSSSSSASSSSSSSSTSTTSQQPSPANFESRNQQTPPGTGLQSDLRGNCPNGACQYPVGQHRLGEFMYVVGRADTPVPNQSRLCTDRKLCNS